MMDKELATFRLGGTEDEAAAWIGIGVDLYKQWPERLWPIQTDRVIAAVIRKETAKALNYRSPEAFHNDYRGAAVIEAMLQRVSIAAVLANLMPTVPPEYRRDENDPDPSRRKRPPRIARNQRPAEAANAAIVSG